MTTAKKTFLLRVTALVTAVLLMVTGIMDYTFATIIEGENALVLDDENVTDFCVIIKDSNGRSVMTGKRLNATLGTDGNDPIKTEDVVSVSLLFRWKKQKFSPEEIAVLQSTSGLIKYHIGKIQGLDIVGIGSGEKNAATSNNEDYNASYWIEGEYLYIRLDEGAYNRNNHVGGFTFTGQLDLKEIADNNGKIQVGASVEYQFGVSKKPELFADKSALGQVQYDDEKECYYQEFQVVVGCVNGSANNVRLEENLGDWFDEIYDVYIDDVLQESSYPKNGSDPIIIEIENVPENLNSWRDYSKAVTVKYRAKLKSDIDEAKLAHYNYGSEGKNTVIAKSDNMVSNESSAWINVQTPFVQKTGTLSADKKTIKWRITVKPTDLLGEEFTLSDKFAGDYSAYIDTTGFPKNLTKDDFTYDEGKKEYYYEFTTTVTGSPTENITIINNVEVKFGEDDDPFQASAGVTLSPKNSLNKTLVEYKLYNPDKGIDTNTFKWQIDYIVPDGVSGDLYIYDKFYEDASPYRKLECAKIIKDTVKVTDDKGNDISFDFDSSSGKYEFGVNIHNSQNYKGQTIHITYQTVVDIDEAVSYVRNTATMWNPSGEAYVEQFFPTYTTHKKVYSSAQLSDKDCTVADWAIAVESNVGFHAGDEVCITDILPEGLTIIDGSVSVDFMWDVTFNALSAYSNINATGLDFDLYCSSSPVAGGRKYTFLFTVPDEWDEYADPNAGGAHIKDEKTAYLAIRYKTKLDEEAYKKFVFGEIAGFTNHAESTVARDSETIEATDTKETFIPDINIDGRLLSKTADRNVTGNLPTSVGESSEIPPIPYEIIVNAAREQLSDSEIGTVTLIDTLGKRLSLPTDEETGEVTGIEVYVVSEDGTKTLASKCWEYNKTLNRLTFTLADKTKYIIRYKVIADFPEFADELNKEDFYNTAALIIGKGNSVTSGEKADWATAIQRQNGYYRSEDNIKYVDLNIIKKWEGTSDYVHNVKFEFTWVRRSHSGDTVLEESGTELYYVKTDKNEYTFTIEKLPAVDKDPDGNPYSYYVYTLKEVAVDGVSLEGVYDVDCGSDGIVIDFKDLVYNNDDTEKRDIVIVNTYNAPDDPTVPGDDDDDPTVPDGDDSTITITVTKIWNDGNSENRPEITFTLERKTDDDADFTTVNSVPDQNGNTYTFTGLQKNDSNGKAYTYRVKEGDITSKSGASYDVVYEPSSRIPDKDGNITVTNTLTTSIKVIKEWKTGDSALPDGLTVKIKLTGSDGSERIVDLTAANKTAEDNKKWSYEWTDLPMYDSNGKLITYSATEINGSGKACKSGDKITIGNDTYKVSYGEADGATVITNTLDGTASVTVIKEWETGDSALPTDLEVQVKLTGSDNSVKTAVLTAANKTAEDNKKWSYKWTGLPMYDSNGKPITYTVEEIDGNGKVYKTGETITIGNDTYKVSYGKADGATVITNTLDGTASVTVIKEWKTGDSALPDGLTVKIKLTGSDNSVKTAVLTAANKTAEDNKKWSYKWTGLPMYDSNGNPITYTVEEVDGNGKVYKSGETITIGNDTYKVSYGKADGATVITNTLDGTASVTVIKEWKTGDSALPDGLTVKIKLTGSDNSVKTAVLTAANKTAEENKKWSYKWTGLPMYDSNGKPITYTVEEIDGNGKVYKSGETITIGNDTYKVSYGEADGATVITNTLDGTTSVKVIKEWKTGDSALPDGLTVKIKLTGSDNSEDTVDLTIANKTAADNKKWSYEWTDLPMYDSNGQLITYTVEEVDGSGKVYESGDTITLKGDTYEVNYSKAGNIPVITNTLTGTTSVKVIKEWETGDSALPDGLTVKIKLTGSDNSEETVDLTIANKTAADNKKWSYEWTDLPMYDSNGQLITYTVEEVDGSGKVYESGDTITLKGDTYEVNYSKAGNIPVITNTLTGTTSVKVIKEWKTGDSALPDGLTVKIKLTGSNNSEETVDLTIANKTAVDNKKWSYEWTDLPMYDSNGQLITYTVEEVDGDGNVCADGDTITIGDDTYKVSYGKTDGNVPVITNTLNKTTDSEEDPPDTGTPELSVEKTQSKNNGDDTAEKLTVQGGDTVTYYIKVTNNGTAAAEDVVVTDEVPNGLKLEVIGNNGISRDGGKTIEWNIGKLETGDENAVTVSFTVTVPEVDTDSTWTNIATASFGDTESSSNEVEIEEKPEPEPEPEPGPEPEPEPEPGPEPEPEPEPEPDPEPEPEPEPDPEPEPEETTAEPVETTTEPGDRPNMEVETPVPGTIIRDPLTMPPAGFASYNPDSERLFNLDEEGLPRGTLFLIDENGVPMGTLFLEDPNWATGVRVTGSLFAAVGALMLAAVAISSRKNKRK